MGKQKTFTSKRKLDSLPVGSMVSFGTKPYCSYWEKDEFGWWESGSSWFQPFSADGMLDYQAYHRGRPTSFTVEREGGELSERQQWISAHLRQPKASA